MTTNTAVTKDWMLEQGLDDMYAVAMAASWSFEKVSINTGHAIEVFSKLPNSFIYMEAMKNKTDGYKTFAIQPHRAMEEIKKLCALCID